MGDNNQQLFGESYAQVFYSVCEQRGNPVSNGANQPAVPQEMADPLDRSVSSPDPKEEKSPEKELPSVASNVKRSAMLEVPVSSTSSRATVYGLKTPEASPAGSPMSGLPSSLSSGPLSPYLRSPRESPASGRASTISSGRLTPVVPTPRESPASGQASASSLGSVSAPRSTPASERESSTSSADSSNQEVSPAASPASGRDLPLPSKSFVPLNKNETSCGLHSCSRATVPEVKTPGSSPAESAVAGLALSVSSVQTSGSSQEGSPVAKQALTVSSTCPCPSVLTPGSSLEGSPVEKRVLTVSSTHKVPLAQTSGSSLEGSPEAKEVSCVCSNTKIIRVGTPVSSAVSSSASQRSCTSSRTTVQILHNSSSDDSPSEASDGNGKGAPPQKGRDSNAKPHHRPMPIPVVDSEAVRRAVMHRNQSGPNQVFLRTRSRSHYVLFEWALEGLSNLPETVKSDGFSVDGCKVSWCPFVKISRNDNNVIDYVEVHVKTESYIDDTISARFSLGLYNSYGETIQECDVNTEFNEDKRDHLCLGTKGPAHLQNGDGVAKVDIFNNEVIVKGVIKLNGCCVHTIKCATPKLQLRRK